MLQVIYADYDATHKGDFVFDIPEGGDSWLLLLTHTPAEFFVDGEYVQYPPNSMVLYKPGQRIFYRACESRYGNDWIRFNSDEVYITSTPIQGGKPFAVREYLYFHKLFQLISREHENGGEMKEVIVEKLMHVMFLKLLENYDNKPLTPICSDLYDLRSEINRNPDEHWTVKKMAEKLNISTGHMENMYKSTFGVSCMEDVINSRINLAKKYLQNSQYSVAEIVSLCGYRSQEHFYRQFKKITGVTPTKFRSMPS